MTCWQRVVGPLPMPESEPATFGHFKIDDESLVWTHEVNGDGTEAFETITFAEYVRRRDA